MPLVSQRRILGHLGPLENPGVSPIRTSPVFAAELTKRLETAVTNGRTTPGESSLHLQRQIDGDVPTPICRSVP
jgi:hypothetical protein